MKMQNLQIREEIKELATFDNVDTLVEVMRILRKYEAQNMEFEIFKSETGKRYYVFPECNDQSWTAIQKELCRQRKTKLGTYKYIPVWILRNVEDENGRLMDHLFLEKVKGSERMSAAVRKQK